MCRDVKPSNIVQFQASRLETQPAVFVAGKRCLFMNIAQLFE